MGLRQRHDGERADRLIFLALLLSWSAVTLDCQGGPEPFVTYLVDILEIRVVGQQFNADTGGWDPVYSKTRETDVGGRLSYAVSEPAIGEVIGWDGYPDEPPVIVAVDPFGNRSDETCN